MRRLMGLLVFFALAGCEPAVDASAAGSDTYVLALSWQPAFCESSQRRPECRQQIASDASARQFSLHGLWPQPGTNVWCSNDRASIEADKEGRWRDINIDRLDEPLWRRLQAAMPGTRSQLHRHEWIKHGTCMKGADAERYFEAGLDLLDVINGSKLADLLSSGIGRNVSASRIREAFEADFGIGAGDRLRISCDDDGSRRLIGEIIIGLKGKIPEGTISRETFAALVLASPATDPGCPDGIVDPAGNQ